MASKRKNKYLGESFEDFLEEEGQLEESTNQAVKRVLAFQLAKAMKKQNLTKVAFAKKIHTSRAQLDRLLDPENTGVRLDSLTRAANAVGHKLRLELVKK